MEVPRADGCPHSHPGLPEDNQRPQGSTVEAPPEVPSTLSPRQAQPLRLRPRLLQGQKGRPACALMTSNTRGSSRGLTTAPNL